MKCCISRCGSQSRLPGKGPEGKVTWPLVAGWSSVTAGETSAGVGNAEAGREGSFLALMISVRAVIDFSRSLDETLNQHHEIMCVMAVGTAFQVVKQNDRGRTSLSVCLSSRYPGSRHRSVPVARAGNRSRGHEWTDWGRGFADGHRAARLGHGKSIYLEQWRLPPLPPRTSAEQYWAYAWAACRQHEAARRGAAPCASLARPCGTHWWRVSVDAVRFPARWSGIRARCG